MKKIKLPKIKIKKKINKQKSINNKKKKDNKIKKKNIKINKTKIYNNVKNIKEKITKDYISKESLIFLGTSTLILLIIMLLLFGKLIAIIGTLALIITLLFAQVLDRNPINSKKRKIVKSLFIIALIGVIIGIIGFIAFFIYVSAISKDKYDTKKLYRKETTIIYDNKNNVIASLGNEKREKLTYDEIPEILIDAIIATEDSRYFQHNGLDTPRFAKAVIGQFLGQGDAGGGSTITMQVSKNNFTSNNASGLQGIIRKFSDIYLSIFKIEKNYSKQEILEFYVNTPYLGGSSYGIEQAAKTYFGKHASELNLSEASLIAGLFQAPGAYDPTINPEDAEERRSTVLSLMVKHGYITKEEKEIAEQIKVADLIAQENTTTNNKYQGYIDYVLKEIEEKYELDAYVTPMYIYTNLDAKKQENLNKVFTGETFKWANDTIQGGAVAIESATGKIVAIGAGRNRTGERTFSYATDINRQVGSTAKPLFDYAPGIEYKNWSTGHIFDDIPWSYTGSSTKIKNYDGAYRGKITMRYSLSDSRNVPAVQAFQSIENNKIKNFVTSLGIEPEIDANGYVHEAHALGAFNGASPLQMAGAYTAFSNGGYYTKPTAINKIIIRDTEEEIIKEEEKKQVMSDATAYMITDILRGVTSQIGATYASKDQIAAKTGTTNYDDATAKHWGYPSNATPDGWIVGYTNNMVVAIWTGYTENIHGVYLTQNQMVSQRNGLFKACASATFNSSGAKFTKPASVISVKIEKGTELLPSSSTPESEIITELFKKGTEPTEISSKYKKLDNVTSLKGELIDDMVKMTWNSVTKPNDIKDKTCGEFGYEVYFNNTLLGFTKNTYYNYETGEPYGTYTIKTVCKSSAENNSNGVSFTLSSNAEITFSDTLEYEISIGEIFNPNPTPITVIENDQDMTEFATIEKTITNTITNETVTTIDTSKEGTYEIRYVVSYKDKNETFTQIITIK